MRLAVLVSGSGTNLQALIDAIADEPEFGGEIVVVASDRADALGLERARKASIPAVALELADYADRPSWEAALIAALDEHAPELVIGAGFMRIVSPTFIAHWPGRVINIHPSLLPSFPGAHGVRDALAHGVKVTGTTVHFLDEEVDAGAIIAQRAVPIEEGDDEHSLHERIKAVEHELLPEVIRLICAGRVEANGRQVRILEGTA